MRLLLLFTFSVLSFLSISQDKVIAYSPNDLYYGYLNDPSKSDRQGLPTTSINDYWPAFLFVDYDRTESLNLIDSSSVKRYSDFLSAINEPILANYYLGKNIIRLSVIRSFEPSYSIRIEYDQGKSKIYEKLLKPIDYEQFKVSDDHYSYPKRFYNESKFDFKINSQRDFSIQKWSQLIKKLSYSDIDVLKTTNKKGLDGNIYTLEVHTSHGWFVISRWSPNKEKDLSFILFVNHILSESQIKDQIEFDIEE